MGRLFSCKFYCIHDSTLSIIIHVIRAEGSGSVDEVKEDAHYVTPHSGGDGALRDAVEYILKAQGKWKRVVEKYIGERSPGKAAIKKEKSTQSDSARS